MNNLKEANINQCVSLLKGYIQESPLTQGKGLAILALEHLQRITAGDGNDPMLPTDDLHCLDKPRAN